MLILQENENESFGEIGKNKGSRCLIKLLCKSSVSSWRHLFFYETNFWGSFLFFKIKFALWIVKLGSKFQNFKFPTTWDKYQFWWSASDPITLQVLLFIFILFLFISLLCCMDLNESEIRIVKLRDFYFSWEGGGCQLTIQLLLR